MCDRAETVVRTKQGKREKSDVMIGVHQGSLLSTLLFVVEMDVAM